MGHSLNVHSSSDIEIDERRLAFLQDVNRFKTRIIENQNAIERCRDPVIRRSLILSTFHIVEDNLEILRVVRPIRDVFLEKMPVWQQENPTLYEEHLARLHQRILSL